MYLQINFCIFLPGHNLPVLHVFFSVAAPIPTMVEHINGETSDEDSDADNEPLNCSVHSTTTVRSNPTRCM